MANRRRTSGLGVAASVRPAPAEPKGPRQMRRHSITNIPFDRIWSRDHEMADELQERDVQYEESCVNKVRLHVGLSRVVPKRRERVGVPVNREVPEPPNDSDIARLRSQEPVAASPKDMKIWTETSHSEPADQPRLLIRCFRQACSLKRERSCALPHPSSSNTIRDRTLDVA